MHVVHVQVIDLPKLSSAGEFLLILSWPENWVSLILKLNNDGSYRYHARPSTVHTIGDVLNKEPTFKRTQVIVFRAHLHTELSNPELSNIGKSRRLVIWSWSRVEKFELAWVRVAFALGTCYGTYLIHDVFFDYVKQFFPG